MSPLSSRRETRLRHRLIERFQHPLTTREPRDVHAQMESGYRYFA